MFIKKKSRKSILIIIISACSLLLASCNDQDTNKPEDNTTPKDSVSQSSAPATQPEPAVEGSSWAVCNETMPEPPHNSLGWCGPKRATVAEAARDSAEHIRKFPKHSASVAICSGVCPVCEHQHHH